MIYGYSRVSTVGQKKDGNSLQYQEDQLKQAGATKIYSEAFTGTKKDRPQLNLLLKSIKEGDTVVVCKLDRIARSVRGGLDIIDSIIAKGASINILNMGTFDNSPSGKLMRTVFFAFSEFERDMIVMRCSEGRSMAKKKPGYKEGRPQKYTEAQRNLALSLLNSGKSYKETVEATGISKATLIRIKQGSMICG